VWRQKVALGRVHARETVTVLVSHDMLTIELDDGVPVVPVSTADPGAHVKAQRPARSTTSRRHR
jgi:hypothetical protein